MSQRVSKDEYYLNIAYEVSQRSTCLRAKYGAVIVKDDRIISTGYNGAPRGRDNCIDIGECLRVKNSIPSGTRYETCRAVHAEANAIMNSNPTDRQGSIMYLSGQVVSNSDNSQRSFMECCEMCKRLIINSGISEVRYMDGSHLKIIKVEKWIFSEKKVDFQEPPKYWSNNACRGYVAMALRGVGVSIKDTDFYPIVYNLDRELKETSLEDAESYYESLFPSKKKGGNSK